LKGRRECREGGGARCMMAISGAQKKVMVACVVGLNMAKITSHVTRHTSHVTRHT